MVQVGPLRGTSAPGCHARISSGSVSSLIWPRGPSGSPSGFYTHGFEALTMDLIRTPKFGIVRVRVLGPKKQIPPLQRNIEVLIHQTATSVVYPYPDGQIGIFCGILILGLPLRIRIHAHFNQM
jgi:hypothetical protein